MGLLDLFGFGKRKELLKAAMASGATVIDVRTKMEHKNNGIDGTKHIPLASLKASFSSFIKKGNPVVFYCNSGMQSGVATRMAKGAGVDAHNGGGVHAMRRLMD